MTTIKHQIKHLNGCVLFEADIPADTPSGLAMRAALEKAVSAGAYLDGANLDGANLTGAYLDGAYLTGANLTGANLTSARRWHSDEAVTGWILTDGTLRTSGA